MIAQENVRKKYCKKKYKNVYFVLYTQYREENYDLQTKRNDRNRDRFCNADRWII